MIGRLSGTLVDKRPPALLVEVNGVGYEVDVPMSTLYGLPAIGERVVLLTHLVVREDAHLLYGFPDAATRELFRALLTVTGIGPRLALGVLSGMSRRELLEAIAGADRPRLLALKGIGKRMVDQILLQLTEKAQVLLVAERAAGGEPAPSTVPATTAVVEDAVAALISIGYAEKDARKQVERAAASVEAPDLERLVRAALSG
jgi:Holliday junction DNA helicase RuvA